MKEVQEQIDEQKQRLDNLEFYFKGMMDWIDTMDEKLDELMNGRNADD